MNYVEVSHPRYICKYFFLIVIFTGIFFGSIVHADDWPTRLHDISRCGVSSEDLTMPLSQAWVYETDNAPEPAWTESPALHNHYAGTYDLKPRQNYDFSFDVSVSGGLLYFGSSKTCEISCLNAVTGQEVWTYFTEGPVRFAPTVADGKVYAGSDDGYVYCLNAGDGSLAWKERVGAEDMIWGNEHMISVWPVRSSVLVDNGQVYWSAGMFPQEGMYLCCRNAADGSGGWTVTPNLPPQGYLLATPDLLFVPSGKTYPMVFHRSSGSFAGFINSSTRDGGAWALLTPDNNSFWTGPTVANQTQEFNTSSRTRIASINGANYLIADSTHAYYNTDTHLIKIKRSDRSQIWVVEEDFPCSIIEGGPTIYAGGDGKVAAFAGADGQKLWEAPICGKAYGLALADNCLYVSTDTGNIYCFSAIMPAVSNGAGAVVQDSSSATLSGELLSEGSGQTSVTLYWGKSDGRMQSQDWQNSLDLGPKTPGPISQLITGLESETLYYYRYCAINSSGTAWSEQSDVFVTGEISLQVADGTASETAGDTGQIVLQRPAWATGEALTVNYNISGTAISDADYEPLTGTVIFQSGQISAFINVLPVDDLEMETDETVVVTLTPGGYLLPAQSSGTITITDNDSIDGYSHRMMIRFSGYRGTETLVDFPALITLNESLEEFSYSQLAYANGSDLRFVSADLQTFLSFEMEQWNVSGDSNIWVKVPEITGSDSYVWLYWGNPDNDQMPSCTTDGSVWSSDFANVWHMTDAGTLNDAMVAGNNGAASGDPTSVAGQIGNAVKFDGSGDYFSLSDPLTIGSLSNTVSAWVKIPAVGTDGLGTSERVGVLLGNYSASPNVNWEFHDDGQTRIYWNNGSPNAYGIADFRDNNWHHVAWVRDKASNAFYLYIDGQLDQTITTAGSDIAINAAGKIGADNRGSSTPYFHGTIDELRVSAVARSADWLKACADNLNNSYFVQYGETLAFNENLVAWWPFDTNVDDFLGNPSYHGTVYGNAVISDEDVADGVGALKIDDNTSTNSYVKIPTSPFIGNEKLFTVVGWYNYKDISSNGSDARPFVFETDNYKVSYGCRQSGSSVELGEWYLLGSPGWSDTTGPVVTPGNWHHVALVYDAVSGHAKHYLDGQLRDNVAGTPGVGLDTTVYFNIGSHRAGDGTRNFDGYIDDMAVFSVELTAAQIQALVNRQYDGKTVNCGNVLNIVP